MPATQSPFPAWVSIPNTCERLCISKPFSRKSVSYTHLLQKTVGIVLHTLKYNDTSNIVDIYTREKGRASFLVSVPRSRKSAVKTVLFQPLSMIEFEADYRPMSNLYRIKEAQILAPRKTESEESEAFMKDLEEDRT